MSRLALLNFGEDNNVIKAIKVNNIFIDCCGFPEENFTYGILELVVP